MTPPLQQQRTKDGDGGHYDGDEKKSLQYLRRIQFLQKR